MESWHPAGRRLFIRDAFAHAVVLEPRHPSADSQTFVLLHGIACSSWAWRFNVEALSENHRVIAICQRGHGWSDHPKSGYAIPELASFVTGTLDALGVAQPAIFVGNSLGGAVSLHLAIHEPQCVAKLLLVNPAAHPSQLPWPLLRTQVGLLKPLYRTFVGPTLLRLPLRTIAYRNLPIDREFMAGFWTPFTSKGAIHSLVETARAMPDEIVRLQQQLHRVTQPTLILWGNKDGLLPAKSAYAIQRHLPHARLVFFEEAGHCPHEECAGRFNALALQFAQTPR